MVGHMESHQPGKTMFDTLSAVESDLDPFVRSRIGQFYCNVNFNVLAKKEEFEVLTKNHFKTPENMLLDTESFSKYSEFPYFTDVVKFDRDVLNSKSFPEIVGIFFQKELFITHLVNPSIQPETLSASSAAAAPGYGKHNLSVFLSFLFQKTVEPISLITATDEIDDFVLPDASSHARMQSTLMCGPDKKSYHIYKCRILQNWEYVPLYREYFAVCIHFQAFKTKIAKEKEDRFKLIYKHVTEYIRENSANSNFRSLWTDIIRTNNDHGGGGGGDDGEESDADGGGGGEKLRHSEKEAIAIITDLNTYLTTLDGEIKTIQSMTSSGGSDVPGSHQRSFLEAANVFLRPLRKMLGSNSAPSARDPATRKVSSIDSTQFGSFVDSYLAYYSVYVIYETIMKTFDEISSTTVDLKSDIINISGNPNKDAQEFVLLLKNVNKYANVSLVSSPIRRNSSGRGASNTTSSSFLNYFQTKSSDGNKDAANAITPEQIIGCLLNRTGEERPLEYLFQSYEKPSSAASAAAAKQLTFTLFVYIDLQEKDKSNANSASVCNTKKTQLVRSEEKLFTELNTMLGIASSKDKKIGKRLKIVRHWIGSTRGGASKLTNGGRIIRALRYRKKTNKKMKRTRKKTSRRKTLRKKK